MSEQMTPARLKQLTNEIIDAITSDEFMGRMTEMRTATVEDRLERAQALLSVEGLKRAGVNLPEGMRISSRFFEPSVGTFEFGDTDVVAELEKIDPQFVNEVRQKRPEVMRRLVSGALSMSPTACVASSGEVTMGTCGGAGAGTVCACGFMLNGAKHSGREINDWGNCVFARRD